MRLDDRAGAPSAIPRGLDGWMDGLWSRLMEPLTPHEEA
jgi:hypothetical protein